MFASSPTLPADAIVGDLEEAPLEGDVAVVPDRGVAEREAAALEAELGRQAPRATLQDEEAVDHAIAYMAADNRTLDDALAQLGDIRLE